MVRQAHCLTIPQPPRPPLPTPLTLEGAWANNVAKPYLDKHCSDYDPDTCDPREGQYDTTDNNPHHPDEEDRKPASGKMDNNDALEWTIMGANGKALKKPNLLTTAHPIFSHKAKATPDNCSRNGNTSSDAPPHIPAPPPSNGPPAPDYRHDSTGPTFL